MTGQATLAAPPAIKVRGLTKTFGHNQALKGIDFEIEKGDSLVIFGPNGAGKSTLIRILATIMNPTAGTLAYNDRDLKDHMESVRRQVGLVPHQTLLYNNLTSYENLDFYGRLYDIEDRKKRIEKVAGLVGISKRLDDRVGTLSRGLQQRVSAARAILHKPEILLLDEPETGLDQDGISSVWQALESEDGVKRTIIFSTHNLELGLKNCLNLMIINAGKIAYHGEGHSLDLEGLREMYRRYTRVDL